jgi:hypothetical protein
MSRKMYLESFDRCCGNCAYFRYYDFTGPHCEPCSMYSNWENGTDPLLVKAIKILESNDER